MTGTVRISVVTPTLDAARYLGACVESVARQEGEGFVLEHVIVDGGSTDDTLSIAAGAGCRVMVGRDDGLYDAMDRGIRAVSSDVVGCLGGDDILAPGAARAIARWYRDRRSEWMVGSLAWIDAGGGSLGTLRAPPRLSARALASLGWCCLGHPATYMTPAFYRELGGFDTALGIAADYLLLCQALTRMPYDRVDAVIAGFRRHGSSLSMRAERRSAREAAVVASRYAHPSRALQIASRAALKLYLNGANPRWALSKWKGRLRRSAGARARPEDAVRERQA